MEIARRPLLVWAIFLFYASTAVWAAVSYRQGYSRLSNGHRIPVPKSVAEQAIRGGVLLLEFAAAIELLRMRETAVPMYVAAWIARAMLTTYDIANAAGHPFVAIVTIELVAFGAFTAIVAYVFSLHRKARFQTGRRTHP